VSNKDKSIYKTENQFDNWLNDLEKKEQPTCSIDSTDDCEACGS